MKSSKRRQQMLQGFLQIEFPAAEIDPIWDALPQIGVCETRDRKFHDGQPAHMADGFHYFEMIDGRARDDRFYGPYPTEQAAARAAWETIKNQRAFLALIRKGRIVKTRQIRHGQPVYVAREFATPEEIAEQEQEQQAWAAARTTAPAGSRAH